MRESIQLLPRNANMLNLTTRTHKHKISIFFYSEYAGVELLGEKAFGMSHWNLAIKHGGLNIFDGQRG